MLEKQVRRANRRLLLQGFAVKLSWCWFAALIVAALAIAGGKIWSPPVDQQAWALGSIAVALVAGLVLAIAWTAARRPSRLVAAIEIDRRFALKERVSSTLALDAQTRDSAVGQALVRDAEQRLRNVDLAEGFRLRLDRRALLPLVPAVVAFALAVLVPVRTPQAPASVAASTAAAKPVKQATKALVKRLDAQKKQALEKGLPEAEAIAKLEEGVRKLTESSKNDKKETLLALNELVKDTRQRREQLAAAADMKKQLAALKGLDEGPGDKLGQALKSGNLEQAVEQVQKLKAQLAEGKLDPDQQQALAKQLEQLEKQLAEKVAEQEQLAQALKEQIEARRREGNSEAAEQLEQQLEKLASQQKQNQKLSEMASQLKQAGQSLKEGNSEQAAEALDALSEQLAGAQEELQEMDALDAALENVAQCKQAMACSQCEGEGCAACARGQSDQWNKSFGQLNQQAQRGGGKGIGVGIGPGLGKETNPNGKFYDSSVKQQPGKGSAKVVGEADGPNRKGQVREEIQTEFAEAEQSGAEAISEQRLPRDYRDHAQKYFDSLRGSGSGGGNN